MVRVEAAVAALSLEGSSVVNVEIALLSLLAILLLNSKSRGGVRIKPGRSAIGKFWQTPATGAGALGVGALFLPGGGMWIVGGGGSIPLFIVE